MKRLILAAALLVAAPLVAGDWGCCMSGEFEVGADALIWRATHCPIGNCRREVAATATSFDVPTDHAWGFRVFGNYTLDCLFAGAHYGWYDGSSSQTVTDPEPVLFTIYGFAEFQ